MHSRRLRLRYRLLVWALGAYLLFRRTLRRMARTRFPDPNAVQTVQIRGKDYSVQEWASRDFMRFAGFVAKLVQGLDEVAKANGSSLSRLQWRIPVLDENGEQKLERKVEPPIVAAEGGGTMPNPKAGQPVLDENGQEIIEPVFDMNIPFIVEMISEVAGRLSEGYDTLVTAIDAALISEGGDKDMSAWVAELRVGDFASLLMATIKANLGDESSLGNLLGGLFKSAPEQPESESKPELAETPSQPQQPQPVSPGALVPPPSAPSPASTPSQPS